MPSILTIPAEVTNCIEQEVKQTVRLVQAELRERTPIDTTTASRSWIVSFAGSLLGTGEGQTFAREDTTPEAQAVREQAGLALLATWNIRDGDILITNSAEYIERLNDGSSRQAPAGFVDLAILAGVTQADG